MRRPLFLFVLAFVAFAGAEAVWADDAGVPSAVQGANPDDIPVLEKTIGLAAAADGYNSYCGASTDMSGDLLAKFAGADMPQERKDGLVEVKKVFYEQTLEDLKAQKADCKSIDFMMDRFALMRQLRAVTYALNGQEPPPEKPFLDGISPEDALKLMPSGLPETQAL
ncbi:MAG: hypothetical protein KDI13_06715 [Alphaproteobacteria bacterium]|nr:hypothetical protein [Alphaproteobacteria bacterium]